MMVDPDAFPWPHMIPALLGKYKILEVSIPQLDLPTFLLLSGLLEEVSGTSDPLMDLATVVLLASMPRSTPPILSPVSPGASAGSPIAPPLIPSLASPAATMQLPMPTAVPLVSPLQTSHPKTAGIPVAQSTSFYVAAALTTEL